MDIYERIKAFVVGDGTDCVERKEYVKKFMAQCDCANIRELVDGVSHATIAGYIDAYAPHIPHVTGWYSVDDTAARYIIELLAPMWAMHSVKIMAYEACAPWRWYAHISGTEAAAQQAQKQYRSSNADRDLLSGVKSFNYARPPQNRCVTRLQRSFPASDDTTVGRVLFSVGSVVIDELLRLEAELSVTKHNLEEAFKDGRELQERIHEGEKENKRLVDTAAQLRQQVWDLTHPADKTTPEKQDGDGTICGPEGAGPSEALAGGQRAQSNHRATALPRYHTKQRDPYNSKEGKTDE